jgi:DNA-binding GntR family transcriptional regulator
VVQPTEGISEVQRKLADRGFVSVNLVTARIGYSRSAVANILKAHPEIEVIRYKRLRFAAWKPMRAVLRFADTMELAESATDLLLSNVVAIASKRKKK